MRFDLDLNDGSGVRWLDLELPALGVSGGDAFFDLGVGVREAWAFSRSRVAAKGYN